jgi:branched-chain amino acid transport system permease protein
MSSLSSALRWGLGALIAEALVYILFGGKPFYLNLATIIAIYAVLALGLGVLAGMTGQLSMGHGALFGVGAYVTTYMVTVAGVPFWLALAGAVLATALCGAVMGVISLRFEGIYFAIVTFAFSALVVTVLQNWRAATGAPMACRPTSIHRR